jgi:HNH endonuclease
MSLSSAMKRQVETWAASRCEYCGMHQALQGGRFHVEHIRPTMQGGSSELDNLALACPGCSLRKADRTSAHDSELSQIVPLFNPRVDKWNEHFTYIGYEIIGQTPVGRATVALLDMNHPRRIQIRKAEELFNLYPPKL